jgi:2-keto-4-pentenoate hydratase/2-oxohepta-3-ene-1,7-dioic acid hydratase in catechol pathway
MPCSTAASIRNAAHSGWSLEDEAMKLARYRTRDGSVHWGALHADGAFDRLASSPFASLAAAGVRDAATAVTLLAPAEQPRVFGVGLNYAAHAAEAGVTPPPFPMLFMKPDTAVIGPGEAIVLPREPGRVDYECELAVVIGRGGRRIADRDGLAHVLGYTCANDVSHRPIQFAEMKLGTLLVGKAFDTFCPLGPWIATGLDAGALDIRTRVNGVVRQSSNTSDLLFGVARLVAYLSDAITLRPGDVILTGTPAGIGALAAGDVVDVEIDGIGVLSNPVAAEPA